MQHPTVVEVFADVACPFTHVGLRRFVALRAERSLRQPALHVHAWPLELVNGAPLRGEALGPKIEALRDVVAPDLFVGFDADRFITTSMPALAAEAAAYRAGPDIGERFSLVVRDALFEDGQDVADPEVLDRLAHAIGAPVAVAADAQRVRDDYDEGRSRGVKGSPHFFAPDGRGFFCPSLDIDHRDGRIDISFDAAGFQEFADSIWTRRA